MHEAHLVDAVIRQVEAAAREHGAERVVSVRIVLGSLSEFSPESLEMYFGLAAEGTVAESAALEICVEQAAARCRDCGMEFAPDDAVCACPRCESLGVNILRGQGVRLESILLPG